MYKVEKKDGALEDFDNGKIVSGIVKAGGTESDAHKVLEQIEAWLPTVAKDGVVQSADIRVKGLEILREVNPEVAASFESFKKAEQ